MNASSLFTRRSFALARELELPSCVCRQLVQTAVPALLDTCAAQCVSAHHPDTAFPAWKHLEPSFPGIDRMASPPWRCIWQLPAARRKIPYDVHSDEIFRDTMGCFSVFAGGQSRFRPVHI